MKILTCKVRSGLAGLCLGGTLLLSYTLVRAQDETTAAIPFGQPLQSPVAIPAPRQLEFDYQAPPSSFNQPNLPSLVNPASERYLVYVNSDSPLMLAQVKRVEPGAFRQQYAGQTVIQSGLFYDQVKAQQRLRDLRLQGIGADIATLSAGQEATTMTVAQRPPLSEPPIGAANNAYFVIVPGNLNDLSAIARQIRRLGVPATAIFSREIPLGPHVAVGPYPARGLADRWSNYLRDFGLDARVYYGR